MVVNPFHVGQKVMTPDGAGEIMIFEEPRESWATSFRVGVKHFVFPVARPRMYPDDILYYYIKEVTPLNENLPKQSKPEEN